MYQVTRANGQHYADNIIDSLLDFEATQTWTTGTGTAAIDNTVSFSGENSLKLENTAPTTDLVATNSVQSTVIDHNGNYQLSCYVKKDDALQAYSGHIEIFKNAVSYNTQSFTLGGDDSDEFTNKDYNDVWIRFCSDTTLTFSKSDIVTIKIQLDGIVGYIGASTTLHVDGIMLNEMERGNDMPPLYSRPVFNKTVQTANVDIEDLTVDTLNLDALNTAPASASATGTLGQIRVDDSYVYVCTATDTWKRTALTTW